MSHLPIQNKNETTPGRAVSQLPVIEGQLTAVKMGHVHITIRKLITWAQVRSGTRSRISPPLQAGLKCTYSIVVDSPLIGIFATLNVR